MRSPLERLCEDLLAVETIDDARFALLPRLIDDAPLSIGSCSLFEPVKELEALGVFPR